jgi:Ca2+/Na+ antiporter
MKRLWYIARAMIVGLLTTQVLATIHVYFSDINLYRTVSAIQDAGYLAIPNALISPTLKDLKPAFCGGIFFMLSLGAGLSLAAIMCAWAWDRLFARKKAVLALFVFIWLVPVFAVNDKEVSPMVTAYFFAVPLVVFAATVQWMPREQGTQKWLPSLVPFLPIALLTIIWSVQADRLLFLDIRDFLLLSNPVGQQVDRFYYRYTLYPAAVFKTLEQKTLKTCRVTGAMNHPEKQRIESVLLSHDYLPVSMNGPVDLELEQSESRLAFRHKDKTVFAFDAEAFLAKPAETLRRFSHETDGNALFRLATIVSLLIGFPVFLYIAVFALIHFVGGFVAETTRASMIAGVACFVMGLALLAPLRLGRSGDIKAEDLPRALRSDRWQERVAALRTVVEEGLEIGDLCDYTPLLTSAHLPERYWIAKALGISRQPATYPNLLKLLDDPHPNVVSMTFNGLGQRGDRRAIGTILKRLAISDHWYNQWYAYRALRALGWKQRPASYS